jgi:hypothetical protein
MIGTRITKTATALLAAGAATMLAVAPAHATTGSTAQATAPATVIWDCIYQTDHAIYLFRTANSTTADYFVGQGVRIVDLGCSGAKVGRHYTDCGGDNRWVHIDGAKHGWAALACITFVQRVVRV